MNNIQRLAKDGNRNHRIFAATVVDLMHSQGFYSRLFEAVNEMDDDGYDLLFSQLDAQSFRDTIDVILWLES